jgi:carbamoyl-phosphate synthase large subunit
VSSVAGLAKTVIEPAVVEVCARAIRMLDPRASGVYSVDLKENAAGVPCITEINAGRFSSATNIFDLAGRHNMVATFVRLARGEPVDIADAYDAVDDWYMLRDIDSPPQVFHASTFFDRIDDARHSSASPSGARRGGSKNHGKFHADTKSRPRTLVHHGRGHAEKSGNAQDAARIPRRSGPA